MNYLVSHKQCKKCLQEKPLEEFYVKTKDSKHGRNSLCIICERKRVNTWRQGSSEHSRLKRKHNHIKFKYGITEDSYKALLSSQDHKCAICGVKDTACKYGTLCVDHDHATGKIRALLCHFCNSGLGHFKDNDELLSKAASYLRKYGNAVS